MKILTPILLLVCTLASSSAAQAPENVSEAVDRYLAAEMQQRRIPGLALAVVKDGAVIKAQGYGFADLEHDVRVTPDTRFCIASVDKQFTATLVMMLAEEGKLGLDDPIRKHIPKAPPAWRAIRIRHLLTHTSGLRNDFLPLHRGVELTDYTTQQIFAHAFTLPLDFRPGTRWNYSDLGYLTLCLLVETVAGKPYHDVLRERILAPLGMDGVVVWKQKEIIKHRASGYAIEDGKLVHNRRVAEFELWDDLLLSVGDLAKWDAALYTEKLLKKSSLDQMWTPATLNDASTVHMRGLFRSYGFGWMLDTFRGHRVIVHTGYTGVCIWRFPDDRTTVIVLTNLDGPSGSNPISLAHAVAGLYVPGASWLALKPKSDPDPALTAALREELLRIQKGQPDAKRYAPAYAAEFRATLARAAHAELKNLGSLESFTFLDSELQGERRLLYFRAGFAKGRYFLRVLLDQDGRIARLQPDRL